MSFTFTTLLRGSACALTLSLALVSGCVGVQQRGVSSADGAYVSTARPCLKVGVNGMRLVTHGRGTGTLFEPGIVGGLPVDTWVAVYARGPQGPAALVAHGELPSGWRWSTVWPHVGSTDARVESVGGRDFAACTFVQPVRRDPAAGLAGEPVPQEIDEKTSYWVVRYLAGLFTLNREKIVLQYREPAPEGELTPGFLAGFRQRALDAFTLETTWQGDITGGYTDTIRWRFVDDFVLGSVMPMAMPH